MPKLTEAKGMKRKGASEVSATVKKVKTTTGDAKPELKSALKKSAPKEAPKQTATAASSKPSRPARKRAEDFLDAEPEITKKEVEKKPAKAKAPKVTEEATAAVTVAKGKAKGSAKQPAVEEKAVAVVEEEEDDDEDDEDVDDHTAALLAGFESSEDENDPDDDGLALDKIPALPNEKKVRKQLKAAGADDESTPGTLFVGRVPHGFYEQQMRAYFSQFGDITHLRLSRNKRTGRSKHYAFIEFGSAAVADIVVKTMDKYLLFGHILQVRRIPDEQVHEQLWKGEGKRFKVMPRNKIEGSLLKKAKTREQWEKKVEKENKKRSKEAEKLKALGYEFEAPVLRSVQDVPMKDVAEVEAGVVGLLDGGEVKAIIEQKPVEEEKVETVKVASTGEAKGSLKRTKSKTEGKKGKKAKTAA